ncbi:MAG: ATP-binding cassette domain-containing protein [Myxococcota bacterium]|nr:ATP-binding cassette domain-containing protein [Myxococcota bacterium]
MALDGLDLEISPGEMVGLIGPNGAGKSTTVKLMTGILRPTGGSVSVGGLAPYEDRKSYLRQVGVVFGQRTQLWWDLAVVEAYDLLASIFEVPLDAYRARLDTFDQVLGLGELLHKPVRELSLGERMRCDLAAALLHGPRVLFLDEPTIGLDVSVKQRIRSFIRQLNRDEGTTVVVTSHDLSDVESLCSRLVLLDKGHKLFDGSPSDLTERLGGCRRLVAWSEDQPSESLLESLPGRARVERGRLVVEFARTEVSAPALVSRVLEALNVVDLQLEEPSMEEVVARFYDQGSDVRRLA